MLTGNYKTGLNWTKPRATEPYDKATFEQGLDDYLGRKREEYGQCKTRFGQYFTWFREKNDHVGQIKYFLGEYEYSKRSNDPNIELTKSLLLKEICHTANHFLGWGFSPSEFSKFLRDWYWRVWSDPLPKQAPQQDPQTQRVEDFTCPACNI